MQLEHEFTVPVPMAQAWEVLLDVERIAPCMPGATVESFDGETIVGRVKVKVGPIQVTYAGTARFVDKDEAARRAVIEANAKEARGSGTANATITAQMRDDGGSSTTVTVTTDLAITGKPAQFGRGVMVEVGNKLLGQFATCLAGELGSGDRAAEAPAQTGAAGSDANATPSAESVTAAGAAAGTATGAVAAAGATDGTTSVGTQMPKARPAPAPTPTSPADPLPTPTPEVRPPPTPTPLRRPAENEPIDLLDAAGLPVLKRLAPVLGGLLLLLVVWRLVARRR